jgi:hypothetical protein
MARRGEPRGQVEEDGMGLVRYQLQSSSTTTSSRAGMTECIPMCYIVLVLFSFFLNVLAWTYIQYTFIKNTGSRTAYNANDGVMLALRVEHVFIFLVGTGNTSNIER